MNGPILKESLRFHKLVISQKINDSVQIYVIRDIDEPCIELALDLQSGVLKDWLTLAKGPFIDGKHENQTTDILL